MTLGVFVDLSKAFDSIDHELLIQKLTYGICGIALKLLESYLSHRGEFVHVNGISSNVLLVHVGVLQGSTLGPLLFQIFVNDLINVDPNTTYIMCTDDTTLLFSSKSSDGLVLHANSVLSKLHQRSVENGLKINTKKNQSFAISSEKHQYLHYLGI